MFFRRIFPFYILYIRQKKKKILAKYVKKLFIRLKNRLYIRNLIFCDREKVRSLLTKGGERATIESAKK